MQPKYADQRRLLQAIRNGAMDAPNGTKDQKSLLALLSAKQYRPEQFFYWYNRFVADFESGVSKWGRVRSELTKRNARARFIPFVKYAQETGLDVTPIAVVKPDDFKKYLSRWDDRLRMRKAQHSDLRQCFNFLLREDDCEVTVNPMNRISIPKYTVKKTRRITDTKLLPRLVYAIKHIVRKGTPTQVEQQRALDMAILTFALSTAARRNAIASIQASKIDWKAKTVTYDDKGKFGIVSSIADCFDALEAYNRIRDVHGKKEGESNAAYLERVSKYNATWADRRVEPYEPDDFFFRRHDGFPATSQFIANIFFRWSEWLEEKILPHMLRKYRGETAYAMSKDLNAVKELMGHSTTNMTIEYLEISQGERIDFMKRTSLVHDLLADAT